MILVCTGTRPDLPDAQIVPATKTFKIVAVMGGARSRNLDLSLRAVKLEPAASVACNSDLSLRAECNVAKQSPARILSLSDRARISIACTDIPHTLTPFKDWGVSTEELRDDLAQKRMRRFGAILRHQEAGFAYNAMVCFGLDERRGSTGSPTEARDERICFVFYAKRHFYSFVFGQVPNAGLSYRSASSPATFVLCICRL